SPEIVGNVNGKSVEAQIVPVAPVVKHFCRSLEKIAHIAAARPNSFAGMLLEPVEWQLQVRMVQQVPNQPDACNAEQIEPSPTALHRTNDLAEHLQWIIACQPLCLGHRALRLLAIGPKESLQAVGAS